MSTDNKIHNPRELINKTMDKIEALQCADELFYQVNIFKQKGKQEFTVRFTVTIDMEEANTPKYIDAIREVHDTFFSLNYWGIRLNSGGFGQHSWTTIDAERAIE